MKKAPQQAIISQNTDNIGTTTFEQAVVKTTRDLYQFKSRSKYSSETTEVNLAVAVSH